MKTLTLFLFFILPYTITAQNSFDYKVGEPYKTIGSHYNKYCFYDSKTERVFNIKFDNKNLIIQSLNPRTLKEVRHEVLKDLPKEYVIPIIKEIKNNIYLFYTTQDKRRKQQQLFAREIDLNNYQFKGAPKKLLESNEKIHFSYYFSDNKDKILVQYREKPESIQDAINHDRIGLYTFDENLNKLAGEVIEMPYTEQKMDNIDYYIDQSGNPFIIAKVRKDGSDKDFIKEGEYQLINYHFELLKINLETSKINITKVDLGFNLIQRIWLHEGKSKNIFCSGFDTDGIYLAKKAESGEIQEKKIYKIPSNILNQMNNEGFEYLVPRKFTIQKDNSILLIGEQYFVTQSPYTDNNGKIKMRYVYHYNDILVTKIDSNGELDWMRRLPKQQVGLAGAFAQKVTVMNIRL